jgi:hypothetical protein
MHQSLSVTAAETEQALRRRADVIRRGRTLRRRRYLTFAGLGSAALVGIAVITANLTSTTHGDVVRTAAAPTPRSQTSLAPTVVPSSVPHYAFAPDAPIPAGYSLTSIDASPPVQKLPQDGTTYGAWSAHYNSASPGTIVLEVQVWSGDTSVTAPNTTVHGLPAALGGAGDLHFIQWSPRPHISVQVISVRGAVDESTLHALAEKTAEVTG